MSSILTIVEQCKRRIKGGNPSVSSNIWDEEIKALVGQTINKVLKVDYFSTNLPAGETIPSGYVLAHYDDIAVTKWKTKSRAKLPAIPVLLPRNMGVFNVSDNDDPDIFYVPVPAGQGPLIKTQPLINELLGKTAYDVKDGYVVFTKDISGPSAKVSMQLVVMDLSKYGDNDLLPIPADMERQVIDEVVMFFSNEPPPDKVVDSGVEPTKTAIKT